MQMRLTISDLCRIKRNTPQLRLNKITNQHPLLISPLSPHLQPFQPLPIPPHSLQSLNKPPRAQLIIRIEMPKESGRNPNLWSICREGILLTMRESGES